jgi:hypothetical protein
MRITITERCASDDAPSRVRRKVTSNPPRRAQPAAAESTVREFAVQASSVQLPSCFLMGTTNRGAVVPRLLAAGNVIS